MIVCCNRKEAVSSSVLARLKANQKRIYTMSEVDGNKFIAKIGKISVYFWS